MKFKRYMQEKLFTLFLFMYKRIVKDSQKLVVDGLRKMPQVGIDATFTMEEYTIFTIENNAKSVSIQPGVYCRRFCNILVEKEATLTIQRDVFFNNYCSINCLYSIEIGENTIFGEGVKLYDHNHKYQYTGEGQLRVERHSFSTGSIKIGKNCWIGSNVTILKDVEIGDNVIVGANNLIYKSIPANSIIKAKSEYTTEAS